MNQTEIRTLRELRRIQQRTIARLADRVAVLETLLSEEPHERYRHDDDDRPGESRARRGVMHQP